MANLGRLSTLLGGILMWSLAQSSKVPGAMSIPPSEYFEGNDGPWSTFNLRIGTPQQDARVLVSTASPETLVVLSEYGCLEEAFVSGDVPIDCATSRGLMFTTNTSSTWDPIGNFDINSDGVGLEANLGYSQAAEFGLETIGLGLVNGSNGPTLSNQTLGGIATASPFYMGIFGLNQQPVNFSTLGNTSTPSFLKTLKDQGLIPSLSWSYTAGAIYRLKKVYAQLIFSGYDTSRFVANPVSLTLAGDTTRDIVVALQAITYSGSDLLLTNPINIFIDSTDPLFWLPASACRAFESAFGLVLDEATNLYLVNDSHRNTLLATKAEVEFRLSDQQDGGDTVSIQLPYQAFDLVASSPLVPGNKSSYYFPLRQAANESQYTLGRTFLQEAYLTVDYERGNFSVSQCSWVDGAEEDIVTITSNGSDGESAGSGATSPPAATNTTGGSTINGISTGAIAGICIAAVVVIGLGVSALIVVRHRRRRASAAELEASPTTSMALQPAKENELEGEAERLPAVSGVFYQLDTDPKPVPEVDGVEVVPDRCEIDGRLVLELGQPDLEPHELDAGFVDL